MTNEVARRRAAIIAEARSWLSTPYHHAADVKGVGVDCGMLLARVFVDTGLCEPFDPGSYPPDWMMHRSEERYLGFIFDRMAEVDFPSLGDVMLFRFGRAYSHGGIVTSVNPLKIVHAYAPAKRVIEEEVARNPSLSKPSRKPRFFSYWRKND